MSVHTRPNSQWETFSCRDGFAMRAWIVRPNTSESLPAVLFIYEPFGINSEMQRVASEIADHGYIVMIPDLMQRGSFFSCIRRLMADFKAERGRSIDDLIDARTFLKTRVDVIGDRIAVLGLCMGGGFAMILAKTGLFRVSAPFYGQTPSNIDGRCPMIASFGGRDKVTRSSAHKLAIELPKSGTPFDLKIYPDAGHGFLTQPPNRLMAFLGPKLPGHAEYNESAARDAMNRLLTFFKRHL